MTSSALQHIELAIDGMTCASCVRRVEKTLTKVPGVSQACVNLATERAQVEYDPLAADPDAMAAAVQKAGYGAHPIAAHEDRTAQLAQSRETEARRLTRDLIIALALTLPVFLLEMGGHLIPGVHHRVNATLGQQNSRLLQFALTTLVLAWPGRSFFTLGLKALWRRAPEMNSLVALGAGAAWLFSTIATFAPHWLPEGTRHVYFEAAAVIVTLILLGRMLEARAKGRTGAAIQRLAGLQPDTASLVRDGAIQDVPLAQIRPGHLLRVRPGERVPLDGHIVDGHSYIDESMLTGEPVPVAKTAGMDVTGGTLNTSGSFTLRVTRTGADTTLARITRMVETAQGARLPIQALVDRVTGWFVPVVMGLALLTFAAWLIWGPSPSLAHALVSAVAVLIIACPCAMGLATPTSIMVGTGRAAELGVLFRQGDALQTLRDVSLVAFDKTGTLTQGKPALTDLRVADGQTAEAVLRLLASVQALSEHPIAQAVVAAAQARALPQATVEDFQAITGAGVQARVQDRVLLAGSAQLMLDHNVDLGAFHGQAAAWGREGKTPIHVALDGKLVAMLAVADPIKPSAAQSIQVLHAQGIRTAMITGDNQAAAQAIARALGIDEVRAEVLPEGKVQALDDLRKQAGASTRLAFVGDGINDAPALASADVGIAIGTGTDVAIEAAPVVLMSDDLRAVADAIAISRATLANIRQNLFWAFAYNAALIPLAAGALYPAIGLRLSPMFAAGAMALSSVFVVANALRLKAFKPAPRANSGVIE